MLCPRPVRRSQPAIVPSSAGRWARLGALGALLCSTLAGCTKQDRPPLVDFGVRDASADSDAAAIDLEASLNAETGDCGHEVVPVVVQRPNLYFVIDRSGSMAAELAGSPYTKYTAARVALADVLRSIGHRVNYGAAIFPSPFGTDDCAAGVEAFPTTPGDPASYMDSGTNGPVLDDLLTRLGRATPSGGTPLAATLTTLQSSLTALAGKTFAVIVTDGAPNCNAAAACGADTCVTNIEGVCPFAANCCDPAVAGSGAQRNCVDDDPSVQAVTAYAAAGIDTYVIGMPGSEVYATVLERLAVAGNTARQTSPRYYAVSDTGALEDALRQIGVEVAVSCDLTLADKPPDPRLVNVYLDTTLLPFDAAEGWSWKSDTAVEIHGSACKALLAGDVLEVRILSGCPTVLR